MNESSTQYHRLLSVLQAYNLMQRHIRYPNITVASNGDSMRHVKPTKTKQKEKYRNSPGDQTHENEKKFSWKEKWQTYFLPVVSGLRRWFCPLWRWWTRRWGRPWLWGSDCPSRTRCRPRCGPDGGRYTRARQSGPTRCRISGRGSAWPVRRSSAPLQRTLQWKRENTTITGQYPWERKGTSL